MKPSIQTETLNAVAGYWRDHGYGPSFRDLIPALGLKPVSTVHARIRSLTRRGLLIQGPNGEDRSLRVNQPDRCPTCGSHLA